MFIGRLVMFFALAIITDSLLWAFIITILSFIALDMLGDTI